jgi:VanZ family protein
MFLLLTLSFCYPFIYSTNSGPVIKSWFIKVAVYVILYGIAMEFVQKYLVYGRSFDLFYILLDALGSLVGLILITMYRNKKIGPNRNRGRNQN